MPAMWLAPQPPSHIAKHRAARVERDMHPFDRVLLVQHIGMATDEGSAQFPLVVRLRALALAQR